MSDKPSASLKNNWREILVIAAVIAGVILVVRNLGVSKNILLVLLGFGAVILVHEFGHFIVAKLCGVKVEAFSICMPPILLGIKRAERGYRVRVLPELLRRQDEDSQDGLFSFTIGKQPNVPGETEYRIGLIPFGGFVKMLGQEDVGPVKQSSDPRSFANKPAYARAAVFAAGVTFNAISAVIVFMIVFLMGIGLAAPIVGGVVPGSPAERAGLKGGDEVVAITGQGGRLDFSDIMMAAALSAKGEAVALKVRHEDGTVGDYSVVAEQGVGDQFRIFGIERPSALTIAKLAPEDANRLRENTGLFPDDRIKSVGGVDINSHWQLEQIVRQTFAPDIAVVAERRKSSGEVQSVESRLALHLAPTIRPASESDADLANICSLVPRLRITEAADTPSAVRGWLLKMRTEAGFAQADGNAPQLQRGDVIVAVADVDEPTYSELRRLTTAHENKSLSVTVLRADANGLPQRLVVPVVPRRQGITERVIMGVMVELDAEDVVVAQTIATGEQSRPIAIPRGASIIAVDGVRVSSFYEIAKQLEQRAGHRVRIEWRLDDKTTGTVSLKVDEKGPLVAVPASFEQPVPFAEFERMYKADDPIDAIKMGYKRTKIFIVQTCITLHRLIGGLVSPKQLMGPVGILTVSYRIVAAQPIIYYVYFLGLISASIAVINFLPLPPFDGGMTLLLVVEKIKGSALSIRTQEILAYAGWGLVGALLLYVTANDIVRSFLG